MKARPRIQPKKKTGETVDRRRQNNGSVNAVSPRHCAATSALRQGSRRDQKIKRREVELDPQVSQAEIMSREVELDPQVTPEEIMSREVELGCESWTSFASSCSSTAVQRTLSL